MLNGSHAAGGKHSLLKRAAPTTAVAAVAAETPLRPRATSFDGFGLARVLAALLDDASFFFFPFFFFDIVAPCNLFSKGER